MGFFFFFSLSLAPFFFFSAGGGNSIPFYCRISRMEAAMGLPAATRAQQAPLGPPPSSSRRDAGTSSSSSLSLSQVFFFPPLLPRRGAMQTGVITPQLKIKTSLGRQREHNSSLGDRRRKARAPYQLSVYPMRG